MSYPKHSLSEEKIVVEQASLPLSCPLPGEPVRFQHPRVYLQVDQDQAVCPFCGTLYIIKNPQ
jgi:uncharacterized Zn-finger protein